MAFAFEKTEIEGFYIIRPHYHEDERGSSMKLFHRESFEERGLGCDFGETLISTNLRKGTIRGFHYQRPPFSQYKLCCCLSGEWDNYSVDLRKGSPTFGRVMVIRMSEDDRKLLYIPEGIANSHAVLENCTRVLYQLSSKYMPDYEGGIRWDSLGIDFRIPHPVITEKDASLPPMEEVDSPFIYGENC